MMSQSQPRNSRPDDRRRRRQRGQELIEFSLVIVPLFAIIFVYLDISWGIFAKATLEQACRMGARYGITNAVRDPNRLDLCTDASTLSDCVKIHVQAAAGSAPGTTFPLQGGLLGGATGSADIVVTYYQSQSAGSRLATTGANANAGGNVLKVCVNGFQLPTLVGPYIAPPSITTMTVCSADTISSVLAPPTPL